MPDLIEESAKMNGNIFVSKYKAKIINPHIEKGLKRQRRELDRVISAARKASVALIKHFYAKELGAQAEYINIAERKFRVIRRIIDHVFENLAKVACVTVYDPRFIRYGIFLPTKESLRYNLRKAIHDALESGELEEFLRWMMFIIDIDGLKPINSQAGYDNGTKMLIITAGTLVGQNQAKAESLSGLEHVFLPLHEKLKDYLAREKLTIDFFSGLGDEFGGLVNTLNGSITSERVAKFQADFVELMSGIDSRVYCDFADPDLRRRVEESCKRPIPDTPEEPFVLPYSFGIGSVDVLSGYIKAQEKDLLEICSNAALSDDDRYVAIINKIMHYVITAAEGLCGLHKKAVRQKRKASTDPKTQFLGIFLQRNEESVESAERVMELEAENAQLKKIIANLQYVNNILLAELD